MRETFEDSSFCDGRGGAADADRELPSPNQEKLHQGATAEGCTVICWEDVQRLHQAHGGANSMPVTTAVFIFG